MILEKYMAIIAIIIAFLYITIDVFTDIKFVIAVQEITLITLIFAMVAINIYQIEKLKKREEEE